MSEFNQRAFDCLVSEVETALRQKPNVVFCPEEDGAEPAGFDRLRRLPVVLVPGAFQKEYPQHGGGGEEIERALIELGFTVHRPVLPSFCSVDYAAERILEWFAEFSEGPAIVVSLSKGGADTLRFFSLLEERSIPLEQICSIWISVCGIIYGTPAIEAIRRERVRFLAVRLLFLWLGYSVRDLESLSRQRLASFATETFRSITVPIYHIAALPRFSDLSSRFSYRAARRIWREGASDGGGVLINDYLKYPGTVVVVPGNDHYFRNICVRQILKTVLQREALKNQARSIGVLEYS